MSKDIYISPLEVFHTVYKTTCLINNKIYIGKHSTTNLDDEYLGSGLAIKRSIKKYGHNNFSKIILASFNTEQEAFDYEKILVTVEFIESDTNYNLNISGSGNPPGENHPFFGQTHSKESRNKMSEARKGCKSQMLGKNHSEKAKNKICKANIKAAKIGQWLVVLIVERPCK